MPSGQFEFDVFLSHSSKDKPVVRDLAERLRADGLRVWLDEWEIHPGDSIPSRIEDGLERSRVLVFCMSANAFGSDWAMLESQTFRFRDPLNKDRRFLPLRMYGTDPKETLAEFLFRGAMQCRGKQASLTGVNASCGRDASFVIRSSHAHETVLRIPKYALRTRVKWVPRC